MYDFLKWLAEESHKELERRSEELGGVIGRNEKRKNNRGAV